MNQHSNASVVILNATAGWDDKREAAERIREIFRERGKDCTVTRVDAGTNIETLAARAVRDGATSVIAGGGDGTIRAVASALAGTGVPMGVLPAGTLNHFARDLDIPLELEQAAVVAVEGTPVCVDLAEVNGHTFINDSVIGLYPFYRIHREQREASGRSRLAAILGALLQTFKRYPLMTVRMRIAGPELVKRTPLVIVANNDYLMEGFQPWRRASFTDGTLSIYILRNHSRWGVLRILARFAIGGRLAQEEFEVLHAEELTIETRWRRLKVAVDGELLSMPSPLHYRSRPGELKVLVPSGSRLAAETDCRAEQKT